MIPRYQRILFWTLGGCVLLMSLFLLRGCQQAHKRLTAVDTSAPLAAPSAIPEEVTFDLASDADGSITAATRSVALPQESTLRARTLLEHLLADYADPSSPHPLQSGPAIDDVFLLPLPDAAQPEFSPAEPQLAVVNLHDTFVTHHPSGIEVEELTLQSIIGTLHTAFPTLQQVRFLVAAQPHDTLAGHADMQRSYPATDTTFSPAALVVEQSAAAKDTEKKP